jgi:SAM-dependent methyltransferase
VSPAPRAAGRTRKQLGAWYTPQRLVDLVVEHVVTADWVDLRPGPIRVLDPACGDARFLEAVARRIEGFGARCEPTGVDIDPAAAAEARRRCPAATIVVADALDREWVEGRFDLVIGNPPFLSQLAAATARGGASRHGGGPYADAAVEFLALAGELVAPDGRVAFVLPRSVLSARDAGPVRRSIGARASILWSWSSDEKVFDAEVLTCVVALEFAQPRPGGTVDANDSWSSVITDARGIPALPAPISTAGTLGERVRLNANFRDEYYGMVPAVGDHESGPPLVTSGLIDPGVSLWGERMVTFAKRRYRAPRVRIEALDQSMRRWAERRLVPKVLIANQTSIIEAVGDPSGDFLPGVPVIAAYPERVPVEAVAAVLTSPFASAWAWQRSAGTGLSAGTIRLGPAMLADLPWPEGRLDDAVAALAAGDVRSCGRAVDEAYGTADDGELVTWWTAALDRIEARRRRSVT